MFSSQQEVEKSGLFKNIFGSKQIELNDTILKVVHL